MPKLGPYFRESRISKPDGRTREARLMASVRAELAEHVGGRPNVAQQLLIDRAAVLVARLHLMDRRTPARVPMTPGEVHHYSAWNAALAKLLGTLGIAPSKPREDEQPQLTLDEYLAATAKAWPPNGSAAP